MDLAVRLVVEDGLPYRPASWHLWRDHRVFVPFATMQNWVEAGGKKAQARMDTDFLDWRWQIFRAMWPPMNGMMVPSAFCPPSIIATTSGSSMTLDQDPTHDDIRAFLGRLHTALVARGLTLCGVTTDGSALYPAPLREVFGKGRHQICQFHIVAEVVKAVVGAVASARKGLAATQPTLPKGRPSTPAAKAAARTKKRLAAQGAALFTHRYLFVQRHRTKPNARPCGASAVDCPSCARYGQSWHRCMRYSIGAVGPRPLWPNWPNCGVGSCGSHRWAQPSKSSFPLPWKRP